ncbi:MAG: ECF transporter S component [Oscillospiraceae bacterium]|jgi:riboflavin transporter FmnP|nr:ECF transporter S component [Oscillospiraceae bacterium]
MSIKLSSKSSELIFKQTALAMLAAISVVSVFVLHFPIIPGFAFLEYDPADIFILLAGLFFGCLGGLEVLVVTAVVQAMIISTYSGIIGGIMHVAATGALVLIACLLHEKVLRKPALLPVCLLLGCIAMTAVMVPMNLIFTPLYTGATREVVWGMVLPAIVPFNAIKSVANSVLACGLYMTLLPVLRKTPMSTILR